MSFEMPKLIENLNMVTNDVKSAFGDLSPDRLNWKPAADSWSVAQCLDHLIKTNESFNPEFEKLIGGSRQQTFWENYSPFSGFFGNFLLKAMKNDSKKAKAPSKSIVPPSEVSGDIVDRFAAHQKAFGEKIAALDGIDMEKTVVSSPFLKVMTYRLGTALEFAVEHEKRHVRQAKRVMETAGFPH